MQKHLTRLLALILCLSFVCSLAPAMATAEESLYFEIHNGEATLIGTGDSLSGDVVIPATYLGYPVTAIGAYAFSEGASEIRSITIPHSVTYIHQDAVDSYSCLELQAYRVDEANPSYFSDSYGVLYNKEQTVLLRAPKQLSGSYTVPSSVSVIEAYAFHFCSKLTEVILPEGLTHIGQRAFESCSKLSMVCLPESIVDIGVYAFSGCSNVSYTSYENGKYLGSAQNPYYALMDMVDKSITAAQIHPDTKLLAGAAFRRCTELQTVIFPEGLLRIGDWQFPDCIALTQLQLPDSLLSIGSSSFTGAGLKTLTIPQGVQSIGAKAFQKCESLSAVTLPDSLVSIGEMAFAETALPQITIGKNVAEIGIAAFYNCWALTGIWVDASNPLYCNDHRGVLLSKDQTVLLCAPRCISGSYQVPDSVTRIESYAFYTCYELTDIQLPEGVSSFGAYAFAYCHGLEAVTIPQGVTALPVGLFLTCSSLKAVALPDGLKQIGEEAFGGCSQLAQLQIPDSVTEIGKKAFNNCNGLQAITIPDGIQSIEDATFFGCAGLVQVSIPDSVRQVAYNAFRKCSNLTFNRIPGTQGQYLGNEENPYHVFLGVSDDELATVTLHQNTKVIADSALAHCEVRNITLPEGLLSIGDNSFQSCSSLRQLTIPNTVTCLGDNAFAGCGFSEIIIPSSVQEIGSDCFSNCKKLSTIRFGGALPQIGRSAFYNVTATAYCHFDSHTEAMQNYGGTITWAEGHVFLNYLPDEGFSCTTGGTKTAVCDGCSATDTITVTEAAEHCYEQGQCRVCGAIDPDGCFLTGKLSSSNDGNTTLTLLQDGKAVASTTVSGSTYLWVGLEPGEYTLTAVKDGHVNRSTDLTIAVGENKLDLTLCLPGDVVGIGNLNIGDAARIYSHIRGTSVLTGYALDCADFDGNGKVNIGDVAALYAKIKSIQATK